MLPAVALRSSLRRFAAAFALLMLAPLAVPPGAGSAPSPTPAPTDEPTPCGVDVFRVVRMTHTGTYAVQLQSIGSDPVEARLTFYTATKSYAVDVRDVAVFAEGDGWQEYRSKPVFVTVPTSDAVELVDAEARQDGQPVPCAITPLHVRASRPEDADFTAEASAEFALPGAAKTALNATFRSAESECTHSDRVLDVKVQPKIDLPRAALDGEPRTVRVRVLVAPDGTVTWANLFSSSGQPELDAAAVKAAFKATFRPALIRCRVAGGTYVFRFDVSVP
jgi:TonB family protein